MRNRIVLCALAMAILCSCGGRTPLLELQRPEQPSSLDLRKDSGVGPGDVYTPGPVADAGFPSDPDSGASVCEFGPRRVCNCKTGLMGRQECEGDAYGPCVCPPQPPRPDETEQEQILRAYSGIVGVWRGVGQNEWEGEYPVTFIFRDNGAYTYSAQCERPDCVALYWGDDSDNPLKDINFFDVFANGELDGYIAITGTNFGVQIGDMTNVYISPDETFLRFNVFNTWSGRRIGPVSFLLARD